MTLLSIEQRAALERIVAFQHDAQNVHLAWNLFTEMGLPCVSLTDVSRALLAADTWMRGMIPCPHWFSAWVFRNDGNAPALECQACGTATASMKTTHNASEPG
jgi:hypothetical protein